MERKTLNEKLHITLIFFCSVSTDLQVLSFSPTDDFQDPVRYCTKLVLIVYHHSVLSPLATHTIRVEC